MWTAIMIDTIMFKIWNERFRTFVIVVSKHKASNQVLIDINTFQDSRCLYNESVFPLYLAFEIILTILFLSLISFFKLVP